jgi:hypothetical protein
MSVFPQQLNEALNGPFDARTVSVVVCLLSPADERFVAPFSRTLMTIHNVVDVSLIQSQQRAQRHPVGKKVGVACDGHHGSSHRWPWNIIIMYTMNDWGQQPDALFKILVSQCWQCGCEWIQSPPPSASIASNLNRYRAWKCESNEVIISTPV